MDDYDLTPEERRLLREIERSQGYAGTGALAGSALGTGVGLLAAGLTGGAALPAVPYLTSAGGAVGGLIGAAQGQRAGDVAMERLQKIREQTEKENIESQARLAAFNRLLGKYSSF